ncbi:MAG: M23 family metallopeptidase [Cyanobacteria bacterium HKST-UBA04]|nr:M23 family metallopeptidase [Cyanobacteria bacterium HKST-UBA04]
MISRTPHPTKPTTVSTVVSARPDRTTLLRTLVLVVLSALVAANLTTTAMATAAIEVIDDTSPGGVWQSKPVKHLSNAAVNHIPAKAAVVLDTHQLQIGAPPGSPPAPTTPTLQPVQQPVITQMKLPAAQPSQIIAAHTPAPKAAKQAIPNNFFNDLNDILDYKQTGSTDTLKAPIGTGPSQVELELRKKYGLPMPAGYGDNIAIHVPAGQPSRYHYPIPSNLVIPRSNSSNTLLWPTQGRISSPYGWRWGRMHTGTDIAADMGSPIRAAQDGFVTYAGWKGGYGNFIVVYHPNGFKTRYGHCSELLVHPGQLVRAGQVIGLVGSTGHSTGPHLHYEVMLPNGNHRDPQSFQHVTVANLLKQPASQRSH